MKYLLISWGRARFQRAVSVGSRPVNFRRVPGLAVEDWQV